MNLELNRSAGIRRVTEATEQQLRDRLQAARRWQWRLGRLKARSRAGDGRDCSLDTIRRVTTLLAAIGIVGSLALGAIYVGGVVDWGPPGSPEYETYAVINRLTGVALALAVAAPVSLWSALTGVEAARGVRRAVVVLAIALCGMVVGSVAEFWVFNDQPYQGAGSEGRNLAWATFLLSAVTLAVGSVVTGLLLLRRALVPRWAGLAVAAAAPVGMAATALGGSLFIAVPLIALALSTATLSLGRRPSKQGLEAV